MASMGDPRDFLDRLRSGKLAPAVEFAGMVKPGDEKTDYIQFSRECLTWIPIPISMIEEINLLGVKQCRDHKHEVAQIRFKEPKSEEAAVFARLITANLTRGPDFGDDEGAGPGSGCLTCMKGCRRHCGDDYFCFSNCLRTWCPEC